jgi:hypothetical protein
MSTGTNGACEFVFVVWSAAERFAGQVEDELARRFRIVRTFDVAWERRHFAANLAAFYGWKSWYIWRNKARKCGTGPFRVIVVEDPSPVWRCECDTSGHRLNVNANVYGLKRSFRKLTGRSNVVHSSVTPEETAHQLAALSSPRQDPIPFRPMAYDDDVRARRERRRVWLGLAADLLVPLSASVFAGAVIWLDLFVLGSKCEENGLVEWSGLAISTICGIMMTACALAAKSGRGAHALLAAFFLDMAIREADLILDRALGARIWPWALSATTLTFAAVTIRYAKTVYSGLRAMRRSRRFQLFACGAALMLFVSQFLGHDAMWRALGVPDAATFSHFIEESVELFGYALMLAWAAPYAFRILCAKCRNMV